MLVKQRGLILLVKELAVPLSLALCNFFNHSLHTGQVPSSWKEANITPIHKKVDPSDVSNYRPLIKFYR